MTLDTLHKQKLYIIAQSDATDEDHIALVFDEGQMEEVLDLGAVDFLGP